MFDPTYPPLNAEIESEPLRAQLNGLKDLIDAVPTISGAVIDGVTTLNPSESATVQTGFDGSDVHFTFGIPRGQEGASATPITSFLVDGVNTLNPSDIATVQTPFDGASVRFTFGIPRGNDGTNGSNGTNGSDGAQGPAGPPFTNFVVDGVNTVNPTDPASVQATFDGSAVRLVFNIPRGFAGSDGSNGTNGSDGAQGPVGPQGPPFANAVVDSVTTLNPGDSATVQTTFDGSSVRFQFGLPRGFNGTDGMNGSDGATGPQGPPGEVTNAQLDSAISGTSSSSNAVSTLDTPFANDPPTLADLEVMRAKLNELIAALRR